MTTLFISDLHLEESRPDIGAQFLEFIDSEARDAEALYILGDLFETWVGDDDPNPHYADCKVALRELVNYGTPVYFMHGNRDFMVGDMFAEETGVTILEDPTMLEMYGTYVLLSHGDALCTDDVEYQQVRRMTRTPEWQSVMLAKPLKERIAFARQAREQSMAHGEDADMSIMDVNEEAVLELLQESGAQILLHGHTHRPDVHHIDLGDRDAQRIVLGDWYEQGSVLRWDENGPSLEVLPR
ncbi:MAG: UDP-2,3-diacylglucosamine diphosphatase [Woeseiaceae bacterium]